MSKVIYKEAYLLDEDVLLKGIVIKKFFRKIFIPNNKDCGFSYQHVSDKDICDTLFYTDLQLVYSGHMNTERVY